MFISALLLDTYTFVIMSNELTFLPPQRVPLYPWQYSLKPTLSAIKIGTADFFYPYYLNVISFSLHLFSIYLCLAFKLQL